MKKAGVLITLVCLLSASNFTLADTFGTGANQFTIDFANISGDASSANGTNITQFPKSDPLYRAFTDPGSYRIGTYEITNAQWNKFKAAYGTVTGTPSLAYGINPNYTGDNIPTTNVSWYEAAQFVNWLNTSTGHQAAYKFTGTQGTSNYTLGVWQTGNADYNAANPYRNSNAFYFLPTEDEWVKAAYWNGRNLQAYATPGNTVPIADIETNYIYNDNNDAANLPWNVGTGRQELNGTYDMMGNACEWTGNPYFAGSYTAGAERTFRGGAFTADPVWITLTGRYEPCSPDCQYNVVGFRVASVIPEPASLFLLAIGGLLLRRKK